MPSVSRGLYKWLFRRSATLEDFADRLNHFWTVALLLLFAAIISWRQTYRSPIQCWMPSQFTGAMQAYTADQCWNSYYIIYPDDLENAEREIKAMLNSSADDTDRRLQHMLVSDRPSVNTNPVTEDSSLLTKMATTRTLYQWLPLILCFQALLFKLPNILMYILHSTSGISFDKVSGLTNGYEHLSLLERNVLCRQIGRYIFNWCQQFQNCIPWRQLTFFWFFIKVLYCINIIAQLNLVDGLLTPENCTSFGEVIRGNLFEKNATVWKDAPTFPKKIFCDLEIVQLQNIQNFKIQCNLPGNYFTEYVYMFIWVWLVFVAVVTCTNLLVWTLKALIPVFRKRYIRKALISFDDCDNDLDMKVMPEYDLGRFSDLIGEDGVMVLKLVGSNSSDLMVTDILRNMWHMTATRSNNTQCGQVLTTPTAEIHSVTPSHIYPTLIQPDEFQSTEKKLE